MSESFELNRRLLLRNILVLAGATFSTNLSLSALAEVARSPDTFLDAKGLDILVAVADTIIPATDTPGALAAGVPAKLDALLLRWAAPDTREMMIASLERIDAAVQAATGKTISALSAEERLAFLLEHDKAALKSAPPPENAPEQVSLFAKSYVVDQGYQRIKGLVVSLYYVSEIGMTQERVYEHVPGKWVPSLKITPGMRPFASPGPM